VTVGCKVSNERCFIGRRVVGDSVRECFLGGIRKSLSDCGSSIISNCLGDCVCDETGHWYCDRFIVRLGQEDSRNVRSRQGGQFSDCQSHSVTQSRSCMRRVVVRVGGFTIVEVTEWVEVFVTW
jgi:hypothetical protein